VTTSTKKKKKSKSKKPNRSRFGIGKLSKLLGLPQPKGPEPRVDLGSMGKAATPGEAAVSKARGDIAALLREGQKETAKVSAKLKEIDPKVKEGKTELDYKLEDAFRLANSELSKIGSEKGPAGEADALYKQAASTSEKSEASAITQRADKRLQEAETALTRLVKTFSDRVDGIKQETAFTLSAQGTISLAQLTGLTRIVVPESGQGALGPVLLPLHNVYADYRNHPTYFRKMERFIEALLDHQVRYDQPRLWNTKGETIAAFRLATNRAVGELFETRSCWQQRWNAKMDGKLRQCGLCAACLLRRMSMHAAGIDEPKGTYVIADLAVPSFQDALPGRKKVRLSRSMAEYGGVGARHLQRLADMADLPDTDLKVHAFEIARATGQPQDDVLEKLRSMLLRHAKEWRAFVAAQGEQSFLRRWTKGGRNGRSE